ncbi:hypothetical protein Angca_000744, partial [Angiostrongylus cantonensis]
LDAESDDVDFDPDELECVDEDAEEERRDREDMHDRERAEKYRYDRSRHSVRDRHRYHPYSRRNLGTRYESRTFEDVRRRKKPLSSPFGNTPAWLFRERVKSSSRVRSSRNRRDRDDRDIPLEELELEEVDCCDEIGDDDSKLIDGSSDMGKCSSGDDDDHNDDNLCSRVYDMSNVVDDFPDLCEDIDVDAMRRAAAATNVVVLNTGECVRPDTSLPTRSIVATSETTIRNDRDAQKMGTTTSRTNRSINNNGRKDEARRRHHHHETRNELRRSTHSERRLEQRERDRLSEKMMWLRDVPPSTSGQTGLPEKVRYDAEIISAKGPFSYGWCSVDEEEVSTEPGNSAKVYRENDYEVTEGHSVKRRFTTDAEESRYDRTRRDKISSTIRKELPNTKNGEVASSTESPKKDCQMSDICEDHGLAIKETSASPRSTARLFHHTGEQLCLYTQCLIRSAVGVAEKIPSLLDMCLKGPMQLQTSQLTSLTDGNINRISFSMVDRASREQKCVDDRTECCNEMLRSRSLLDLNIHPPDQKAMREYAISLNNRELAKRPVEERSGIQSMF